MKDVMTVIRAKGKRLTKLHRPGRPDEDKPIVSEPYDSPFLFESEEVEVEGIREVGAVVGRLERQRDKAIIRGRRKDALRFKRKVRRAKKDCPQKGPGGFESCPRRWICVDIDKLPWPEGATPDEAIRYAVSQLPAWLQGVTCFWQWSSSAGVGGWSFTKLHLWFWLDRPVDDASLKHWAKGALWVDSSLFESVQIHYTAAPVFSGLSDPAPHRHGFLEGEREEAQVPRSVWQWAELEEERRRKAREERAKRPLNVSVDDPRAKAWLQAGLDAIRAKLTANTQQYERHETAKEVAGSLVNYVQWGWMTDHEARAVLDISPLSDIPERDGELDSLWGWSQEQAAANPSFPPAFDDKPQRPPMPPIRPTRVDGAPSQTSSGGAPPPDDHDDPPEGPPPSGIKSDDKGKDHAPETRPIVPFQVFERVISTVTDSGDPKGEIADLLTDVELAQAAAEDPTGFDALALRLEDLGCTAKRVGLLRKALAPKEETPHHDGPSAWGPGDGWPDSDNQMALRLVERCSDRMRHGQGIGWISYDDAGVWLRESEPIWEMACESATALRGEVEEAWPEDFNTLPDFVQKPWRQLWTFAKQTENFSKVRACVELARVKPQIKVDPADLDACPWTLNVYNGTLDLLAGTFRAHDPQDLLTRQAKASYDHEATCPQWERFLLDIMEDDPEMVRFLQRAVGYCLTGSTKEQCFFLLHGEGSNGKSTFLDTLGLLLGDYAKAAQFSTFADTKANEGIRNDIADLRGSRLVSAVEPSEGVRLAEGLVKQLTGGDAVKARFLYQEGFEFKPTFKVFLACNSLPQIRGTDHGIWRRVRLIPFLRQWRVRPDDPEEWPEADKGLTDKLKGELPGILAWAVRGAKMWLRDGLAPPDKVLQATAGYRAEQDTMGTFIEECCVLLPQAWTSSDALYEAYQEWAKDSGIKHPWKKPDFGRRLARIQGVTKKRTNKRRGWQGIGLLENTRSPP